MPFWRKLLIYLSWKLERLSASPIQDSQKSLHVRQKLPRSHRLRWLVINVLCLPCRWCVDVPISPACTAEHRNRRASELKLVFTLQPLKIARSFKHGADSLCTTNSSNLSLVSSKLRTSGEHSATGRHFESKSRHLLFYLLYVYACNLVIVSIEPGFPLMHKFETKLFTY